MNLNPKLFVVTDINIQFLVLFYEFWHLLLRMLTSSLLFCSTDFDIKFFFNPLQMSIFSCFFPSFDFLFYERRHSIFFSLFLFNFYPYCYLSRNHIWLNITLYFSSRLYWFWSRLAIELTWTLAQITICIVFYCFFYD